MRDISSVTGKPFEIEDVVYFRNLYQSAFYLSHGAKIVDVFSDSQGKIVFVFAKSQHNELIKLWMENKNKNDTDGV
jgi:ribosomal protein S2